MRKNLRWSLMVVAFLWAVYFLNYFLPVDLRAFGIQPRHWQSLGGILLTPFLHGDFGHLLANSGALLVLLVLLFSYFWQTVVRTLAIIILGGGSLVWLCGPSHSVHIGASGVILGLIGFFLLSGYFRRGWKDIIVSAIVLFLYGGVLVMTLLDLRSHVSWSGHFFGLLSGMLAAKWPEDG